MKFQLGLATLFCTLVGCTTARVVTKYPGKGGVIAIKPQDSEEARHKAEALMRQNCNGGAYTITKEGEEVVGSKTQTDIRSQTEPTKTRKSKVLGLPVTVTEGGTRASESSTTHHETEWRLAYECK